MTRIRDPWGEQIPACEAARPRFAPVAKIERTHDAWGDAVSNGMPADEFAATVAEAQQQIAEGFVLEFPDADPTGYVNKITAHHRDRAATDRQLVEALQRQAEADADRRAKTAAAARAGSVSLATAASHSHYPGKACAVCDSTSPTLTSKTPAGESARPGAPLLVSEITHLPKQQ